MKKVFVHKGALIRKVAEEEAVRLKARGFKELNPPAAQTKQTESKPENGDKTLSKMTKAELLAEAGKKGLNADDRLTKEAIIKLLEEAEKENNPEE